MKLSYCKNSFFGFFIGNRIYYTNSIHSKEISSQNGYTQEGHSMKNYTEEPESTKELANLMIACKL